MMATPTVEILLSTYNGEAWIIKQLKSIQSQTYPHWRLWIRDDLSIDSTKSIVIDFCNQEPRAKMIPNSQMNLGPAKSFAKLLEYAYENDGKFFAFCDQDDEWHSEKLETQIHKLISETRPALCFSDLKYCNENLNITHGSYLKHMRFLTEIHSPNLSNLLCQNFIVGCTTMVNRNLVSIALPFPHNLQMHDWWLALVCASAQGAFYFIEKPLVNYRIHKSNASGAGGNKSLTSLIFYWKKNSFINTRVNQALVLKEHIQKTMKTREGLIAEGIVQSFIDIFSGNRFVGALKLFLCSFKFQGYKRQLMAALLILTKSKNN